MDLGKRLKECREARGITQKEMAMACGLSKNYISAMERGINKCSAQTLIDYATKLDMTLNDLVSTSEGSPIMPELRHVLYEMNEEQQRKVLQMIELMR